MEKEFVTSIKPSIEALQLLTTEQAWQYSVVPYKIEDGAVFLYSASAQEQLAHNELSFILNANLTITTINEGELSSLLNKHYRRQHNSSKKSVGFEMSDDFLVNLIKEAKQLQSSDIHIEQYERKCRIRFRIDGKLIERYTIAKEDFASLIIKIKNKARLNTAEKRLPQDGRISFSLGRENFDIRVSVMPSKFAERVVLRLLTNDASFIDLKSIGLTESELEEFQHQIKKPSGIILVCGPTGSGKSTSLYAALKHLNKEDANIMTIEDPVEYVLEGVNQIQVKEDIGLTFASALRAFLRQDPDIMMVGEIRDVETATMAIRASLTGHLVLSTIHTNSAWGAITRLIDMGIAAYQIAGTLNATIAQRLLRKLCESCKQDVSVGQLDIRPDLKSQVKFHTCYQAHPDGCSNCYQTGYSGRRAIYEMIPIDEDLIKAIRQEQYDIKTLLKEKNIQSLSEKALKLVEQGTTSMEEVYPILSAVGS